MNRYQANAPFALVSVLLLFWLVLCPLVTVLLARLQVLKREPLRRLSFYLVLEFKAHASSACQLPLLTVEA